MGRFESPPLQIKLRYSLPCNKAIPRMTKISNYISETVSDWMRWTFYSLTTDKLKIRIKMHAPHHIFYDTYNTLMYTEIVQLIQRYL